MARLRWLGSCEEAALAGLMHGMVESVCTHVAMSFATMWHCGLTLL